MRTPITIDSRRLAGRLVAVAAVLTVLSLIADAVVLSGGARSLAGERIVALVDLDAEANAPTFSWWPARSTSAEPSGSS